MVRRVWGRRRTVASGKMSSQSLFANDLSGGLAIMDPLLEISCINLDRLHMKSLREIN